SVFYRHGDHRDPHSFPTRRSSDLSYAKPGDAGLDVMAREDAVVRAAGGRALIPTGIAFALPDGYAAFVQPRSGLALKHGITLLKDRKSTRLNSSHVKISYAVFCLK